MPIFDALQPASFADITFPIESCRVRGGLRDHVHEYPHAPGGAGEKLGRKLYEIEMVGNFQAVFPDFPDLYPRDLQRLRETFENEETADLVIPSVGTIQAYAIEWDQNFEARIRSGEKATFRFREDQSSAFLVSALVLPQTGNIASQAADFAIAAEDVKPKPNLFDQISELASDVAAIKDTATDTANLVEGKVLALASACQKADSTLHIFDDPAYAHVHEALHNLWFSAVTLHKDLHAKGRELSTFVVPMTMPIGEIARALYGDASKGGELLSLNPIKDAYAVKARTEIRYYKAA